MHEGQVLLRMGSRGKKSPTLAMRVRSLINFRGGHELFMLNPREEEYLQKVRDRWEEKSFNNNHQILSLLDRIICLHMMMN